MTKNILNLQIKELHLVQFSLLRCFRAQIKTVTALLRCREMVPPTNGADADVCGFAGRAVAEAGNGAVVAGRWYQTRNGDHVGGGGLRLKGLRKRKKRSDL